MDKRKCKDIPNGVAFQVNCEKTSSNIKYW